MSSKSLGAGLDQKESSFGEQEIRLSVASTSQLQSLAQQHQLTLNTLVQGAWALLLSRYSGEADVVFGATRACRHSSVTGAEFWALKDVNFELRRGHFQELIEVYVGCGR